ncbi:MAG: DUF2357 domain-containing protein [Chloroflexaceae bacterium]|nr:DUF2357 domain-containing protein [Chloroflexaceae bacterium]
MKLLLNNVPYSAGTTVQAWQDVVFASVPPPGGTLALALEGPLHSQKLEPFLRPGDPAWYWRWNPRNDVGRVALVLHATMPDSSTFQSRYQIDIVPRKLDQEHYALLLRDIEQVSRELVYGVARSSAGQPCSNRMRHPCPISWNGTLFLSPVASTGSNRSRTASAPTAVSARPAQVEVPIEQAHQPSGPLTGHATIELPPLEPPDERLSAVPATLSVSQVFATSDTYEHRMLRSVIDELHRRARQVADMSLSPALQRQHTATMQRLAKLRRLSILEDVPALEQFRGMSHQMRHDPTYREVYRLWQELRQYPTFSVVNPALHLPINDLPRLYEIWCVLHVMDTLLGLPGVAICKQHLFAAATSSSDWALVYTLHLTENAPLLQLKWRGLCLCLRYQPRYRPVRDATAEIYVSLDAHVHIPDIVIEVQAPDGPLGLLVLDAKYRLDASGGLPLDALADAYTYLGGIGLAHGQHSTRTSMVLYPGGEGGEQYASGVGALALLPERVSPLHHWLHYALNQLVLGEQ